MNNVMVQADPNGIDQHAPGAKLDANKPKLSMVLHGFPNALAQVARTAEYGAEKYSFDGWRHVENGQVRYTDALLRHLTAESAGRIDDESGLLHAAQVAWNALARLELMLVENDSRLSGGNHEA